MERERLTRLLNEPGRTTAEDAAELAAMVERYPWFSGAQLLRAASERNQGQVLADDNLRTAAAHLPSRAALFDLVHPSAPAPMRVVRNEPETSLYHPQPEPLAEPAQPLLPEAISPVEPESAVHPETADLKEAPVSSTELADDPGSGQELVIAIALPVHPEPVAPVTVLPSAASPELEAEYVQVALARAYDLTWQEQVPETQDAATKPVNGPAPETVSLTTDSRLRFSDWLEASDATAARTDAGPSAAVPLSVPPTSTPTADGAAQASHTGESLDPKALIDRFIRQQPPEIPAKPAFFTPQQAGKKSLEDSAGLVTETLARIYEQQGNISKAMEAYRRLALKYPEKSAYFAALSKAAEAKQTP
ncbi:MAG: hypothetical protein IPM12_00600 [Flavobacteriales bacterium]|nr:hypothetical protein [Flavobacteriales bacterium]